MVRGVVSAVVTLLVALGWSPSGLVVAAEPVAFQIVGEIIDREQDPTDPGLEIVGVWGQAIPVRGNPAQFGANLQPANLAVMGAKVTHPIMYQGLACFLTKTTTTNRFGAPVALWIYAPCSKVPAK